MTDRDLGARDPRWSDVAQLAHAFLQLINAVHAGMHAEETGVGETGAIGGRVAVCCRRWYYARQQRHRPRRTAPFSTGAISTWAESPPQRSPVGSDHQISRRGAMCIRMLSGPFWTPCMLIIGNWSNPFSSCFPLGAIRGCQTPPRGAGSKVTVFALFTGIQE
jgi:hypothetical protein